MVGDRPMTDIGNAHRAEHSLFWSSLWLSMTPSDPDQPGAWTPCHVNNIWSIVYKKEFNNGRIILLIGCGRPFRRKQEGSRLSPNPSSWKGLETEQRSIANLLFPSTSLMKSWVLHLTVIFLKLIRSGEIVMLSVNVVDIFDFNGSWFLDYRAL